jgi:hypothetical protein
MNKQWSVVIWFMERGRGGASDKMLQYEVPTAVSFRSGLHIYHPPGQKDFTMRVCGFICDVCEWRCE